MRRVLLGVGNPLARDDGVGVWVAERLRNSDWIAFPARQAPENVIGKIASLKPDLLVVVDAALMGYPPGTVRRLPSGWAPRYLGASHSLPIPFILTFLEDRAREIVFVGIEPGDFSLGEGLTPRVRAAAEALVETLRRGDLDSIPALEGG